MVPLTGQGAPPDPSGPQLVFPGHNQAADAWSPAEREQDIAVRPLYRNDQVSTHLIRLAGREPPHRHDRHDLSVTVLAGSSRIHFADRQVDLRPGDTVFVPRGAFHWAENTGAGASVVFAVFAPAYRGQDRQLVDPPAVDQPPR